MSIEAYPTTQELLDSLKAYIKTELKDNQKIIQSVKAGLIDIRDELPLVMILPTIELIRGVYNDGLFDIERSFGISVVNNAFKIEEVRESLKMKVQKLRELFSMGDANWWLFDTNGNAQVMNFNLQNEMFGEPVSEQNKYTQFCSLQLNLRSYFKVTNLGIQTNALEYTPIQLLDYLYDEIKTTFTTAQEFWRDVPKPISLLRFPAIGIFLQAGEDDKDSISSLDRNQLSIIFRVYSSLATKEVAFNNHLKIIENLRTWILQRPSLNGCVDSFDLSSIDYGIDTFERPYQGNVEEIPVFRSDFTIICSLLKFN